MKSEKWLCLCAFSEFLIYFFRLFLSSSFHINMGIEASRILMDIFLILRES